MTTATTSGFAFETTPRIICMQGSAHRLAEHLPRSAARRVLVVTDRGLVDAGMVAPVLASLADGGLETVVFDGVRADPPAEVVEEAVALARAERAELVVGLGGGSAMDTAKLVALLATGRQGLTDVYGIGLAEGPRLPLVAVPTTAGTGSEVTPIAIVTTPDNEKVGVVSPLLYPDVARARQHPDPGAAAVGDRDDRRRRHGARDRGVYQQDGQESALRYVRAARAADAPRQHRPRRRTGRRCRRPRTDAPRRDDGRQGVRERARRRRARPRLSARRALPPPARPLQLARARIDAAVQPAGGDRRLRGARGHDPGSRSNGDAG